MEQEIIISYRRAKNCSKRQRWRGKGVEKTRRSMLRDEKASPNLYDGEDLGWDYSDDECPSDCICYKWAVMDSPWGYIQNFH